MTKNTPTNAANYSAKVRRDTDACTRQKKPQSHFLQLTVLAENNGLADAADAGSMV
ncbi:MAG: hypothetical protein JG765_4 [Cereibacter sp.]|jgi:hypothetical protein|nr:hypothetical protein [Cereibacter sp.]